MTIALDDADDAELAAALRESLQLHQHGAGMSAEAQLRWALRESAAEAARSTAPEPPPLRQPRSTAPEPPPPRQPRQRLARNPAVAAEMQSGQAPPTVPATPTTEEATGQTIRPTRQNRARLWRERKRAAAAEAAVGETLMAVLDEGSAEGALSVEGRRQRQPRRGPPIAPACASGEHSSWHLPELPPPAEWSAVDSRSTASPVVVWLRQDMRLADNPALHAAARTGRPVIPLFILPAASEEGNWPLSGVARYWQHHALSNLQHSLRALRSALVLRDASEPGRHRLGRLGCTFAERTCGGGTLAQLLGVVDECGAGAVYWNACYEPWRRSIDAAAADALRRAGVDTYELPGATLYEPWQARPDEKAISMGFGSVGFFLSACAACGEPPAPLAAPTALRSPPAWPSSLRCSDLGLAALPRRPSDGEIIDWAKGVRGFWAAGEAGAHAALEGFLTEGVARFEGRQRHRADQRNTAVISPYLRFGELTSRQVVARVRAAFAGRALPLTFLRRLAWRDLACTRPAPAPHSHGEGRVPCATSP